MSLYSEDLIRVIDEEKHARRPGPRPARPRPRRRHRLAAALHHLADRIDLS